VIAEQDDLFGDGVNIAARLETLSEPGGIAISRSVRDQPRISGRCCAEEGSCIRCRPKQRLRHMRLDERPDGLGAAPATRRTT
jgi:class 3 adenylate cyclase